MKKININIKFRTLPFTYYHPEINSNLIVNTGLAFEEESPVQCSDTLASDLIITTYGGYLTIEGKITGETTMSFQLVPVYSKFIHI